MTSSYLETSVFARPHKYNESPFPKLSTLESVFENLRLPENAGYMCTVAIFGEKSLRFPSTQLCVDGVDSWKRTSDYLHFHSYGSHFDILVPVSDRSTTEVEEMTEEKNVRFFPCLYFPGSAISACLCFCLLYIASMNLA